MDDAYTFTFPDFSGNLHFNTIGNLSLDSRVGVLFPDFQTGDLLTLTGAAQISWDGADLRAFEGAERLIQIKLHEAYFLKAGLPIQTTFQGYSPFLAQTGSWT